MIKELENHKFLYKTFNDKNNTVHYIFRHTIKNLTYLEYIGELEIHQKEIRWSFWKELDIYRFTPVNNIKETPHWFQSLIKNLKNKLEILNIHYSPSINNGKYVHYDEKMNIIDEQLLNIRNRMISKKEKRHYEQNMCLISEKYKYITKRRELTEQSKDLILLIRNLLDELSSYYCSDKAIFILYKLLHIDADIPCFILSDNISQLIDVNHKIIQKIIEYDENVYNEYMNEYFEYIMKVPNIFTYFKEVIESTSFDWKQSQEMIMLYGIISRWTESEYIEFKNKFNLTNSFIENIKNAHDEYHYIMKYNE